jgi:hypothetical protein
MPRKDLAHVIRLELISISRVHTCAVHTMGQLQRPGCDSHHMPWLPASWRNCRRVSFTSPAIAPMPSLTGGGMRYLAATSCAGGAFESNARELAYSGEGGIAVRQATEIPSHTNVTNRISMQVPQYVWSGGSEASVSA